MISRIVSHTFIDLFAGIGGMRIAFERAGAKCVFSSEIDRMAQLTYQANFGETPSGDITSIRVSRIPSHDVLTAGFPCQPFSLAGISKKKSLDMPVGFEDLTQGTMFFEIARILRAKRPKAFLLENVKNLKSHDKGKTFRIIEKTLSEELGYDLHYKIIDSRFVVPQHRERIYIVGFRKPMNFIFPSFEKASPVLRDILEEKPLPKYTITDKLYAYLDEYARRHRARGNGFGYSVASLDGHSRTLSARYFKDGSEILIPQGKQNNPRRLTPRECARLMGFPDSFKIVVSDTQAYRQFGNSVVVPVVEQIARAIMTCLTTNTRRRTIDDYSLNIARRGYLFGQETKPIGF
jgi:DNA (cytosine-5)-methyltransferase 1